MIHIFRDTFFTETYPAISEENLAKIAIKRANIQNEDDEKMLEKVQSEFRSLGKLAFSFDSATPPAIKQMRHKLLMANIGAVNFEMDELGSNLTGNGEALNTFLELFDIGKVKQKLTKNTKDSIRNEEIDGRTPCNMLLYGTPSRLFDGARTEDDFYSFLETGYARRCIFGYSKDAKKITDKTPEELYDILTDTSTNQFIQDMANKLGKLADITNHNKIITVSRDVSILIIKYRLYCEKLAGTLGEHQAIEKAELCHRYFKALKLAGVYAFIDGDAEITEDNFYHAICLVEESGKAFTSILERDGKWVKLAKYIGSIGKEVTHVELADALPFFKGTASAKQDLIQMASAWGYKNHIVIKRSMVNGIEFLSGESLKKTDLSHLVLSYSDDIADGYKNVQVKWEDIYKLTQQPMKHWINHHSKSGHRDEDNMIPGFSLVVLDVDTGTTVKEVLLFLKKYKFLLYTTKRHTAQKHRFRIILPLNYQLNLTSLEYTRFMKNVYEWIPFEVDTQTSQRSRKWLSNPGQYHYTNGDRLLDARLFIPKTTRNDERKSFINNYQSLTNMERWFVQGGQTGNRNNQLARYAFMLVDMGYQITDIKQRVLAMNEKLPDKLSLKELKNTVIASAERRAHQKQLV